MNDLPPNHVRDGESMREFHARVLGAYREDQIAPAVDWLRGYLDFTVVDQIRTAIAADPEHWVAPYHFFWGMAIRNALRQAGFGEDYWPIWNLDDIYVPLVERAVGMRT